MSEQKTNLTASQRLDGLEKSMGLVDQTIGNLSARVNNLVDAVLGLNEQYNTLLYALENNIQVNKENLDKISVEKKILNLKEKVEDLVSQGIMLKSDEVTKKSFLVLRELDLDGNVIVPRTQLLVSMSFGPDLVASISGKKVGDTFKVEEDADYVLEIQEIYEMQTPAQDGNQNG